MEKSLSVPGGNVLPDLQVCETRTGLKDHESTDITSDPQLTFKTHRDRGECGGVKENSLHRFIHVNVWFSVGGLLRKD